MSPFFISRTIVYFFRSARERRFRAQAADNAGGYKPDVDAPALACYAAGCVLYSRKECNAGCTTAVGSIADGRRTVCVTAAVRAADGRRTMTLCAQGVAVAVEWGREADGKGTGRGSGCGVPAQAGRVPYDVKNVYKNRGSAKCDFTDS